MTHDNNPFLTNMKISLLQRDLVWANPAENARRARAMMLRAPKSDLYLLPEMCSTGFVVAPKGIAETDDLTLQWMIVMAAELDAAIAGSVAVEVDGQYHNRLYFVKPDGSITRYDKRHLFGYSGEQEYYTAGNERVVVDFRGVRFLLQVCYDLRFPVWSRNRGDYDCILYVANWPDSRMGAWWSLLKARAIENQCYVCGVNRVGKDHLCQYSGGSAIVHPYGLIEAQAQDGIEDTVTGTLDMAALEAFRTKFPVLKDGDLFTLQSIHL